MNCKQSLLIPFLLFLYITPYGCSDSSHDQETSGKKIEQIQKSRKLIVVTRNAPTMYYEGREGPAGFEFDLVSAYAKAIRVKPVFVVKDNLAEILTMMSEGKADIAAAGLTHTENRKDGFLFVNPYYAVREQVVCRRGGKRPGKPEDLVGISLVVPEGTSYIESLKALKKKIPKLEWEVNSDQDTEYLLEQVWLKKIDCTVADSNIVSINRRYYPELTVQFDITKAKKMSWLLPGSANDLQASINNWLKKYQSDGKLKRLLNKYYGFIAFYDYVDVRIFKRRVSKRLPKYKKIFIEYAKKHDMDWTLLAAQAYQESHWNPRAKSPTGVRGIMMLTLSTAKEVGIKSRLDPKQSIEGGALYLSRLRSRLPEKIKEPDRTWIALAAYNVGMGHIYDARELARQQGKNPDLWHDLKQILPLLSQKKYFRKLKYGYARGTEPVRYVDRIRNYQDMLLQTIGEYRD
jgi:membrane-bound lytic murein transglycosylase F